MNINEITEIIKGHKGQNLRAVWIRPMKTRKGVLNVVEKMTTAVIRGGVNYDNITRVIEGREDGTLPAENAGLKWGEWVEFPFHITHKGGDYVRLYPASGLDFVPTVTYFIDGVEVSKEEVEALCLASEFRKTDDKPLCFTLKAESVVSIG